MGNQEPPGTPTTLNRPRRPCTATLSGRPRPRLRRALRAALALSLTLALTLPGGCAVLRKRGDAANSAPPGAPAVTPAGNPAVAGKKPVAAGTDTRTAAPGGPAPDPAAPPSPQWRTTGEALGLNPPAQQPVPLGQGRPAFTPFSPTQPDLGREVALICGSARISKQKDPLPTLVTDLYLSNVDPALATEALLQGDCGTLAEIVRELVAQGGNEVVAAVVGRALFLGGPSSEATIRAAASSGLNRDLVSPVQRSEPALEATSLAYSMAYFPSRGAESGVATATVVDTLYSNATPGYGVYTFVLPGAGFDPAKEADRARYAELLRVIETYVLAGEQGARGPRAEAHAFLVAIRPDRQGAKLSEQTAPELSTAMRADLIDYLRRRNQPALAARLETLPGPFLVSSLEPRLLPTNELAPRLVTDLSMVGPEYLYAVVDAYDRALPPEQQGRPEALGGIRERLLALFSRKAAAEDLSPSIKDAWVFRLGGPSAAKPGEPAAATPGAAQASTPPTPAAGQSAAAESAPETVQETAPAPRKRTFKRPRRRS